MCLDTVTKMYPEDDMTEGEGWKVFVELYNGDISVPCYGYIQPIVENEWVKAETSPVYISLDECYKSGFHIFKTEEDAKQHWLYTDFSIREDYRLKKVKFRGIICEGEEGCSGVGNNQVLGEPIFSNCLVVKEIFIGK